MTIHKDGNTDCHGFVYEDVVKKFKDTAESMAKKDKKDKHHDCKDDGVKYTKADGEDDKVMKDSLEVTGKFVFEVALAAMHHKGNNCLDLVKAALDKVEEKVRKSFLKQLDKFQDKKFDDLPNDVQNLQTNLPTSFKIDNLLLMQRVELMQKTLKAYKGLKEAKEGKGKVIDDLVLSRLDEALDGDLQDQKEIDEFVCMYIFFLLGDEKKTAKAVSAFMFVAIAFAGYVYRSFQKQAQLVNLSTELGYVEAEL